MVIFLGIPANIQQLIINIILSVKSMHEILKARFWMYSNKYGGDFKYFNITASIKTKQYSVFDTNTCDKLNQNYFNIYSFIYTLVQCLKVNLQTPKYQTDKNLKIKSNSTFFFFGHVTNLLKL